MKKLIRDTMGFFGYAVFMAAMIILGLFSIWGILMIVGMKLNF